MPTTPTDMKAAAEPPGDSAAVSPLVRGWLAQFRGCDSPTPACFCDDRLLNLPHQQLRAGRTRQPDAGVSMLATMALQPLALTDFAPSQIDPPGTCLNGPCPSGGPVRYDLVGPGGDTRTRYGTWSCANEKGPMGLGTRGRCKGPMATWAGESFSDAWLDIAPEDEALHLFVGDRRLYSLTRSRGPMDARLLLIKEPEFALAISFGEGTRAGTRLAVDIASPMVDRFAHTSLEAARRPGGCWSLIELGDLPFVDPLVVTLADGFRTEVHKLPPQDRVPRVRRRPKLSAKKVPLRLPGAKLARRVFRRERLRDADLSSADLRKAHFDGVNARRIRLRNARMARAYMRGCDFAHANLRGADLRGAHLIDVDLREADLRGANLQGSRLDDSNLRGAKLQGARNLTQAQLDEACGDRRTKLPPGLRIAPCWSAVRKPGSGIGVPQPPPVTERLVASASTACDTTLPRCTGACCKHCGHAVWTLASDPAVVAVPGDSLLPEPIMDECGLHFDLLADGRQGGDRFVVHTAKPVPSEDGRTAGTRARLTLRAEFGRCTTRGCSEHFPCCNSCSFAGWRPKPTGERIEWSGVPLPMAAQNGCQRWDLSISGTWRGPAAFEVTGARRLHR